MKRIINLLFSSATTIILMLVLIFSMGIATFIEEKYDTYTAQIFVYRAVWFEIIFILLVLNMIGHIVRFKMVSGKKWASLLFHCAFIIIITGAGITRYFGFEGSMHIREGEETNIIHTQEPWLTVLAGDKTGEEICNREFSLSPYLKNTLHAQSVTKENGTVTVDFESFLPNAVKKVRENDPEGGKLISFIMADDRSSEDLFLADGRIGNFGMLQVAYNNTSNPGAVLVSDSGGSLTFRAPMEIIRVNMTTKLEDTIAAGTVVPLEEKLLYRASGAGFMLTGSYPMATIVYATGTEGEQGHDAIVLNISAAGKSKKVTVFGGKGNVMFMQDYIVGGVPVKIGYGEKPMELPFSLKLNDFILERYAGSMSPSSYASEVTLTDTRKNLREDHRIFMNHVLDYDRYRFFQSSYDKDELGTVLSVNHDFWGTMVTYAGYLLLVLGFIFSLLNRNSRFHELSRKIGELRSQRKAAPILTGVFMLCSSMAFSQPPVTKPVSADEAEQFGKLLTQSFDGRFEPVHSLAYDMMHKIARRDHFNIPGKGEMNAVQVLVDMVVAAEFWKEQKIIYIREPSVQKLLGIDGKYASFLDFFDENREYKLQKAGEEAFRKKQSEQNSFDKEVIKADERLNIFVMAIRGSLLKLFPDPAGENNKWMSWDDKSAQTPLAGPVNMVCEQLQITPATSQNIMMAYFREVFAGAESGDYVKAARVRTVIRDIQRNSAGSRLLASDAKIRTEILYNKLQIFITLRNVYGVLSLVLLLLAFIDNVRQKKSKLITFGLNISIALLAAAFLYHTFGMILRWYLTGHAPWSNGYESLILIAWGGLLAGFSFARYSRITLAATTLLAFFTLMTASHSSYDPQLTNLQPVLKSYWLIIHVATLTISYGFLGLGFILGLMNLAISLFKTARNRARLDLIIGELTCINEMNLIVGIVLATIGTFLGGVWANESWGRYWGWDAKETWALVIVVTYTLVLHLRFIPGMRSKYVFNLGSVAGFGSVIMTFVGVNYYLSKGMHSYGAGDTPVFPLWAWGMILSVIALMVAAGFKERSTNNTARATNNS